MRKHVCLFVFVFIFLSVSVAQVLQHLMALITVHLSVLPFRKQPHVIYIKAFFLVMRWIFLIQNYERNRDDKSCSRCLWVQQHCGDFSVGGAPSKQEKLLIPSLNGLILFLCQVATGEPSSLSTTTGPCSFGGAGRADPPFKISLALPDQAYEATALRQTLRTQRMQRVRRMTCTDKTLAKSSTVLFSGFIL